MAQGYGKWGWAGSNYGEWVYFEVWHKSRDIPNNRSTYGYKIWNDSYNSYGDTGPISWRIADQWNNSRVTGSRANTPTTNYNQNVSYSSGTFIIYHNPDGSMPNINFKLHISRGLGNITSVSVPVTVSDTPTIPRASTITSVNGLTVPDHSSVGFNIQSASTGFRHTVDVVVGSTVITTKTGMAGGSNSIPLTQAHKDKIIASMPNSTSVSMSLRMSTWSGSTRIGSNTIKSFTANLGGSIVPSITGLTTKEAVAEVSKNFSVYVQGKSRVYVTTSRVAGQSASIKETNITISGVRFNGTTATSGLLSSSGSVSIVAEVVDSRNRRATRSTTINVVPYSSPTISGLSIYRSNAAAAAKDDGTNATAKFTYAGASVSSQNKVYFKLEYRKKGTAAFTLWTTGSGLSGSQTYTSGAVFDINSTYEIQLIVNDLFYTVSRIVELSTAFTMVDYRRTGHGIAFGKVSESDMFEVNMPAVFYKALRSTDNIYQNNKRIVDFNSYPDRIVNGDFNDYWRHGVWVISGNDIVRGMKNAPPNAQAGRLVVTTLGDYSHNKIPWMVTTQTYTDIGLNVFMRVYNTNGAGVGNWSFWVKVSSRDQMTWVKCPTNVTAPYCDVRRIGDVVHFRARFNGTFKANDWKIVATIPEGYRPAQTAGFGGSGEGGVAGVINVGNSGNVELGHRFESATRSWFIFTCSWVLG